MKELYGSHKDIPRKMCEDLLELYYSSRKSTLQENEIRGGCHEQDVANIVRRALWKEGNDSITLEINKSSDDYHLDIKIQKLKRNVGK